MKKITQAQIKTFIQLKLTEDSQAIKTLVLIYNRQTATEQQTESTHLYNEVGFTGVDAPILTSFAKQYLTRNWLSPKQMALLKKKIAKYWKQVYSACDQTKLYSMVEKAFQSNPVLAQ